METITGIYLGERGMTFKKLITSLLKKGNIKQKYIDILTDETSMEIYSAAFTSELVDDLNNYQVYEQLGDLTVNKFIVWYIYKRFPQLQCAEGVKVAARLRINYGSKNSFCEIAEQFGFWDFISATNDLRQRKKKPLLEDVFEAFVGATETIIDNKFRVGVGYACVNKILTAIFDDKNISLNYEDLYDAKTRLKELFDLHGETLGPLVYEDTKEELITKAYVYRLSGVTYATKPDGTINTDKIIGNRHKKILIGEGAAALKADAQQNAAASALVNLATQGYIKRSPAIYAKFSGERRPVTRETTKNDILKICEADSKINEQFYTRGKSKYQSKYTSPALAHYCKKRDLKGVQICLEMGADPNGKDSEGMTPIDMLLIGKKDSDLVSQIINCFGKEKSLQMHKNVYEVYGRFYELIGITFNLLV